MDRAFADFAPQRGFPGHVAIRGERVAWRRGGGVGPAEVLWLDRRVAGR
ncbi:hypothetical protein [Nonomuraea sp. B1E8]